MPASTRRECGVLEMGYLTREHRRCQIAAHTAPGEYPFLVYSSETVNAVTENAHITPHSCNVQN